ncbi:hypothetical protein B7486_61115, partial [cyanobacterium TDX16]
MTTATTPTSASAPTTDRPVPAAPRPATLTVPARFTGPVGMANGGWLAGSLARLLPSGPAMVTLRAPTPLDRALEVREGATGVSLWDGDVLLAEAEAKGTVWMPPSGISFEQARRAEARFAGLEDHPFPGCFVCGTDRGEDALRIHPGPVVDRPGLIAATWTPSADLGAADGLVDGRALWAALDCPTGWAHFAPGGVAVLGRITGQVLQRPEPGEPCVVAARRAVREGRKLWATSGVYRADGSLAATAAAT